MTRIWIMSDLHDDYSRGSLGNYSLPRDVDADVIVIAGDVAGRLSKMGRSWLEAQNRGIPIVVVAGNHDYWRGTIDREIQRFRDRSLVDFIHLLDGEMVTIAGTRFVGATLWTDYAIWQGDVEAGQAAAGRDMNDFRYIRIADYERRLQPWMLAEIHRRHLAAIEMTLATPFDGPTVVVTHHAPSPRSLRNGVVKEPGDAAYASDLEDLILDYQPELWIHGHVHTRHDYAIGATRVICNPRGYVHAAHRKWMPAEIENREFDERLVVEVGDEPAPGFGR
ncbi:MAG TPA: metallophosphoesterase [Aurantimonas coralicida]|uniref:Metallophosphoesterase n=1 Tax=Aurantimonas coralicida TaxID=182270 RepID=A0A9C9TFY3_9HYPH|nr:metallophosphoesterase [Aurantimonas coralicida]HET99162.1 metallophosphoesterase [Aurantimonas coralicida]